MEGTFISSGDRERRAHWVANISHLSGNFGTDVARIEDDLSQEIKAEGIRPLLGHLRLCGAIPESYGHDSSEEKPYSKYTDVVIHEDYTNLGFMSLVLKERADVADVECACSDYSFVADAKAFRLSPNPPKDTDGRGEDSGRGVRELQGRYPGLHWGRWEVRRAVCRRFWGRRWRPAVAVMREMAR